MVIFGGVGIGAQTAQLKRGVDILVATPGRLLDHQGQGNLDLSRVEILVLDEADRMLDMGFIRDIKRILVPAARSSGRTCCSRPRSPRRSRISPTASSTLRR